MSNNYEEAMSARLPEHLLGLASQQESSAASLNQSQSQSQEEFSRWLESFVLLVLDAEPLQMQAGRQIGAAVSWLLSTNQSGV